MINANNYTVSMRNGKVGSRTPRGGTLGLVAAIALALVVIAIGFFIVSMYFGGSRETRNAADAGALNVGKEADTIAVPLNGGDEQEFADVTDTNGQITLANIDRVWAKALLAGLNASQAQTDNQIGSGLADAEAMQEAAQSISTRLSQALSNPANLTKFYLNLADANSTRMLGTGSSMQVGPLSDWQTSFTDRGYEGNVDINSKQIPIGSSISSLNTVSPDGSASFLTGYKPITLGGTNLTYWQVPFRKNERPQLISKTDFDANSNSSTMGSPSWSSAVPNAFSTSGNTTGNTRAGLSAMAWVQSNPEQLFHARMPHECIKIQLDPNTLNWYADGLPWGSQDYSYSFNDLTSNPFPLECGTLTGDAQVGMEYTVPTLFNVMFVFPPYPGTNSGVATMWTELNQRAAEMNENVNLTTLLSSVSVDPTTTDSQTFVIYNSDNGPNAQLMIAPSAEAPAWTNECDADGTEQEMLADQENVAYPDMYINEEMCDGVEVDVPFLPVEIQGQRFWTPGTGYHGCLGKVRIKRTASVYLFGFCSCPV